MTLWIGIAPGAKGAIVMLGQCTDPLLIQTPSPDPGQYTRALVACLEIAAHQHEGQVRAALSLHEPNRWAGWWEGALSGLHIPFCTVEPVLWQLTLDLHGGSLRERTLSTACARYPKLDLKPKDEGVATALHTAAWLRAESEQLPAKKRRVCYDEYHRGNVCTGFGVHGSDELEGV